MQEMFQKNKLVIFGIIALLLIGGIAAFAMNGNKNQAPQEEITAEEEEEAPIPTVDASVKVEVTPVNNGREVEIAISNAPEGTEDIDVELSYETEDKGLQGAIGTITVEDRAGSKKITLGTCSSGTCVYHTVSSDVKVYLKFNGEYGEQIYENNFSISE